MTTTYKISDWEQARIMGKRAFYERSTQTIRAYPENYCLAHRTEFGKWVRYGEDNATRGWWEAIDNTIKTYANGSTGDALATAISESIKNLARREPNPLDGERATFQADALDY